MWSTRKVLFPVFKCFVRLWGGYDIVGCYFSGVGMSCFLLQSAIPALAKHLLRPTVLILALIPFNLIFFISFFRRVLCSLLASLGAGRLLLPHGEMEMGTALWQGWASPSGSSLLFSMLPCILPGIRKETCYPREREGSRVKWVAKGKLPGRKRGRQEFADSSASALSLTFWRAPAQ